MDFVVALAGSKTNFFIDYLLISVRWLISIDEEPFHNSCGYTCLLSKVTLWVIALGWDRSGFPVRFSPPVTLQIITQGQLLTWQYLAGNLIHHGDRKPRNKRLACGRSSASHTAIPGRFSYPKLRVTKNA